MPNRTLDSVCKLVVNMDAMGCPHPFIASTALVSEQTVHAILTQWRTTGSIRSILTGGATLGQPRVLGYNDAWVSISYCSIMWMMLSGSSVSL